jgi:hypothetical protein
LVNGSRAARPNEPLEAPAQRLADKDWQLGADGYIINTAVLDTAGSPYDMR